MNSPQVLNNADKKRIIIFRGNNSFIYFYLKNNKLHGVRVYEEGAFKPGDIVVCKVEKKKKEINGYFVRLSEKINGLLLEEEIKNPIIVGKSLDSSCNDTIKVGDEIIVQVKKEANKNKLENKVCVVSTKLEMPGLYTVFQYDSVTSYGYSKKLNKEAVNVIKEYLNAPNKLLGAENIDNKNNINYKITFRTACDDCISDLKVVFDEAINIKNTFDSIINRGIHSNIYNKLYDSDNYIAEIIKNNGGTDNLEIITSDAVSYNHAINSINNLGLNNIDLNNDSFVKSYCDENISLATFYGLNSKLENLVNEKVWLKSGAYLFISPTPALTVIDVNSGKAIFKNKNTSKEDVNLEVNIEAACEIAYQIEARNISGIIIVDFINMQDNKSKNILISKLISLFGEMKPSPRYISLTKLGLVEITREKKNLTIYDVIKKFDKNILR